MDAIPGANQINYLSDQVYLYMLDERLGMICENRRPTAEQLAQARREAEEYCDRLVKNAFAKDETPA